MYKNILVPLDGSDNAYKALEHAANLAKIYESQVYVLSVFRHHSHIERSISMVRPREPENLDDVLSAYAKEVVARGKTILQEHSVHKIRGFVKIGRASKKILEFTKNNEVDLIVMSAQGHGDLTGNMLGGVASKIAGLSECPVLII